MYQKAKYRYIVPHCPFRCKVEPVIIPDLLTQSLLDDLDVYCSFKENGCNWSGKKGELHKHTSNECDFIVMPKWLQKLKEDANYKSTLNKPVNVMDDFYDDDIKGEINKHTAPDLFTRMYNKNRDLVTKVLKGDSRTTTSSTSAKKGKKKKKVIKPKKKIRQRPKRGKNNE